MKKIFILAFLFFAAAVVVAGFVFKGGINFISSRNVDINILGPTVMSAGEKLELGVSISNTNNADLEFANLSIQYPPGSRNPNNTAESLTYTKDDLGVIKAGTEAIRDIRMVLLGSTGEIKEIKFSVEYKVKGSNATFYKDKIFEVTIGDAPITLTVNSPSSVTSGNSFTTVVSISLNSLEVLKDVVLKAEYPYGYSVLESTPEAVADDNIWLLGDLSPGDRKTISIRGRLVGENEEERTFRFYVGVSDQSTTSSNLKITLVSLLNTVVIDRPSIGLNINLNGDNVSTYMTPPTRPVSTSIKFQNNMSDKLLNPRLEVNFSGLALDKSSVRAGGNGLYDSGSSKVVWSLLNPLGNPELSPGQSGQVTLSFASLPAVSLLEGTNDIVLNISLTGVPVGAVGQGSVTVTETRTVRISSQVNFTSKILRSLGSFANHGPIPPKVGEGTTYTIVFSIVNNQNRINDAKVTAKLGSEVTWASSISSIGNENIVYDSASNSISWDIGDLPSSTETSSVTKELSFQVSLIPILGQIGTAPTLVHSILLSGRDTVTGNTINISNPTLTTRFSTDPSFVQGDDIVQK
ncbi:MAG: hypothetical protein HYT68_00005 [Candidatus Zambryskibacteria bacterium]|nr:hypothetical protein [Candidatus Zambryskibacteria bacterium]